MARLLMAALGRAGHEVELFSAFSSRDSKGDFGRQGRLESLGGKLARRLIRRISDSPRRARPDLWFTYHLYHKAPDWLGPAVSSALGIPYLVCEASFAPKQDGGPWALGHESTRDAISGADAIIGVNSNDAACVLPLLETADRYHAIKPFIDIVSFARAGALRDAHHAGLVAAHDLDPQAPLLLTVAMMRDGDKLASYRVLADALAMLDDEPWQLLVVGDGPARDRVEAALEPLGPDRVRYAGAQAPDALTPFYAAADMLVWPAINEAYGMALLEAQATGLPVIAGRTGGVADIVRDGETGLLAPVGDAPAFAEAVRSLLQAPYYLAGFSAAARDVTARDHSIEAAAKSIDAVLTAACGVAA